MSFSQDELDFFEARKRIMLMEDGSPRKDELNKLVTSSTKFEKCSFPILKPNQIMALIV